MIWLQTGFAMVVLSAAIKGVSTEVIEAARLDGAIERQLFLRVIVPMIRGSIITVATTIAIVDLKIFDIVYVTTGGRFGDDVVANRMFQEMFQFFNDGRAAALATLLFVAVLPVMYINLRNFRRQQVRGMTAPAQTVARAGQRVSPPGGRRSCGACRCGSSVVVICFLWTHADARSAGHVGAQSGSRSRTTGWWTALLHPFAARPVDAVELQPGPHERGHGQRPSSTA